MTAVSSALAQEYPAADDGRTITVRPIREAVYSSSSTGSTSICFTASARTTP